MITNNKREKQVSSVGLLEFRAGSTDQSIAHFWYRFVYKWSLSAHFVTTHWWWPLDRGWNVWGYFIKIWLVFHSKLSLCAGNLVQTFTITHVWHNEITKDPSFLELRPVCKLKCSWAGFPISINKSLLPKMVELNLIQSQQLCGTHFGQDSMPYQLIWRDRRWGLLSHAQTDS